MLMIKDDESLDKLIANAEYKPQQIKDYIIDLQAEYEELKGEYSIVVTGYKKLQERNNKAIEYTEHIDDFDIKDFRRKELSKILKGENYEENENIN